VKYYIAKAFQIAVSCRHYEESDVAKDDKIPMQRNTSRLRQEAKRVGIKIDPPEPHVPMTEQEQTDTM
jgi:hypothetical protein